MPDRTAPWPCRPASAPGAHVTPHYAANGKLRWLTTLPPQAAAAYEAAVAQVVPAVERRLGPGVMADRARGPWGVPSVRLAPWGAARRRWHAAILRRLEGDTRALVLTDVRECFASVTPALVRRALTEAGAPLEAVDRVLGCLHAFHEDGVVGLPVGPVPSAVLANAALAAFDEALGSGGVPSLRWVDDVVAFAPSAAAARAVLDTLRRASDATGLALHDAKTRIVVEPQEARAIVRGSNSPGTGAGVA